MDKDQVKGRVEQAKCAVKEATGKVVGSRSLEAEGQIDKATGKAQAVYGDIKEDVKDATKDASKDAERRREIERERELEIERERQRNMP